jgi:hypothetical protein
MKPWGTPPTSAAGLGSGAKLVSQGGVEFVEAGGARFIRAPTGRTFNVPDGWEVRLANGGDGIVAQRPGSPNNVWTLRVMDPNAQNPAGYFRYSDGTGQYSRWDNGGYGANNNDPYSHPGWDQQGPMERYP